LIVFPWHGPLLRRNCLDHHLALLTFTYIFAGSSDTEGYFGLRLRKTFKHFTDADIFSQICTTCHYLGYYGKYCLFSDAPYVTRFRMRIFAITNYSTDYFEQGVIGKLGSVPSFSSENCYLICISSAGNQPRDIFNMAAR
jgi:hypothetical protein